jgi:hypothetical protein
MIQKRWTMYWLVESAAVLIYILLCISDFRMLLKLFAGGILDILSVYWLGYYYTLKYSDRENVLLITSGIVFRRERRIPLDSVLWKTRLTLLTERNTAAVILHTSGGAAVVFGKISTHPS